MGSLCSIILVPLVNGVIDVWRPGVEPDKPLSLSLVQSVVNTHPWRLLLGGWAQRNHRSIVRDVVV